MCIRDSPVVVQADDGLVDAGDLRLADHTLELRAQAVLDFAALLLDAAGGALDGIEQGALEAHLGRLPEARVAHVEVDVRQELALQLVVEEVEQLFLEAALDEAQVAVSYTHLRAHETRHDLVCRLLL